MSTRVPTEAAILRQVLRPTEGDFAPQTAREILKFSFNRSAKTRIRLLLQKNNRGVISDDERATLEKYLRVGQLVDLLQAKARCSLKSSKR